MKKTKIQLVRCLLFSAAFLVAPLVFAQESDQSSPDDSGVLVSPPIQAQGTGQDSRGSNRSSEASDLSGQGASNSFGQQRHQHAGSGSVASQNTTGNSNNNGGTSNSDGIVDKATSAVISEMTANLKLTQGQTSAIQPIVAANIAKGRVLQQSLLDGTIDPKTMNSQRQQLTGEENMELGSILTPDQMKMWMNIQVQDQQPPDQPPAQSSSNSPGKHNGSK